eukprot:760473-Ditylum_brightwellii.AAC.1
MSMIIVSPTLHPSSQPTTSVPTASPTTISPTFQPTTQTPTLQPTTEAPTLQPTTKTPTLQPTTDTPTLTPNTVSPTMFPTVTPSAVPTRNETLPCDVAGNERFDQIFNDLATTTVSNPTDLSNPLTPQGQAVAFLACDESLNPDSEDLVQRYVTALFYFSTNGDNWTNCSKTDLSCGASVISVGGSDGGGGGGGGGGRERKTEEITNDVSSSSLDGKFPFLYPVSECNWAGITCNTRGKVAEIRF